MFVSIRNIIEKYPHLTYSRVYGWLKDAPEITKRKGRKIFINEQEFDILTQHGRMKPRRRNTGPPPSKRGDKVLEINFDKKPKGKGSIRTKGDRYRLVKFPLGYSGRNNKVYVSFTATGIPTVDGEYKGWGCDTLLQVLQKQQECINFRDEVFKKRTLKVFNRQPPLAEALLIYYNRYMRGDHASAQTRNKYVNWVNKHVAPFFGDLTVVDVDSDMLQDFINEQTSQRNYREVQPLIKKYFKWATAKGIIQQNAADLVSIPKQIDRERRKKNKREKYIPTTDEMKKFYRYVAGITEPDERRFVIPTLLLIETGMRIGEVLALQWDDIDLDKCVVRVNKSWESKSSTMTDGKNDYAERYTAFSPTLVPLIKKERDRARLQRLKFLLQSRTGTPIQYKYFKRFFLNTARLLDFPPNFTPHATRHWWCTVMAQENPHNLQGIAKQAGHSDLRMMMTRYAIHDTGKGLVRLKSDLLTVNNENVIKGEFGNFS